VQVQTSFFEFDHNMTPDWKLKGKGLLHGETDRIWRACMFDIKEEATHTKLTGTDKDKKTAAKAVCMRQGRCRLGVQHHAVLQRDRRLQFHRDDPRHCYGSIVIGGRERRKGFVV
jgi:hypothetical protein